MLLPVLFLNLFIWQIAANRLANKKNIFHQADLLQQIVLFFICFSLVSMLYILSVYCYMDFPVFLLLLSIISCFLFYFFKLKSFTFNRTIFKNISYSALLPVLVALLILSSLFVDFAYKWGGWDSIAIWSLHAKYLTLKNNWHDYLTHDMAWSHPDYPLMLSSYIALLWQSFGSIGGVVPSMIAYLTLVSIALAAYLSLSSQNFKLHAIAFLFIVTFNVKFIEISSWLNADILLSLFFLLSFILFNHFKKDNKNILILVGVFAASSGWVKNEGILFFVLFSTYFILFNSKNWKNIIKYLIGSIVPVLMILGFKYFYATGNDIMTGQQNDTFEKLLEFKRYEITYRYFLNEILADYHTIFVTIVFVIIFNRPYFKSFAFKVLMTVLMGYFFIYIITPLEIKFHLETSCRRLLHQLYPSFLYTLLWALGNVDFRKYEKLLLLQKEPDPLKQTQ